MARKKTVSISAKPSAQTLPLVLEDAELFSEQTSTPPPFANNPVHDSPAADEIRLNPIGRVVYGTVYCLSYGVVFSAMLLGKIIPGSGLIARGMHDGADAAQHVFESAAQSRDQSKAASLKA